MKLSLLHPGMVAHSIKQLLCSLLALANTEIGRQNENPVLSETESALQEGSAVSPGTADPLWLASLIKVLHSELSRGAPNYQKRDGSSLYTEAEIEAATAHELLFLHGVIED